ncbi:MAG: class I SAM-dependent methyltransferase [Pseudomonadota bacterium]
MAPDEEFEKQRALSRIAPGPQGAGFPEWTQDGVESLTDFFNNTAHLWDQKFEHRYGTLHQQVANAIPRTENPLRILDVGCGTGLELKPIFERVPNAKVTAMDQSPQMLDELARKFALRSPQIELRLASCLEWPADLTGFDVVVSVLCAHHFDPPTKTQLYGNFRSSLNDNGFYVEGDQIAPAHEETIGLALYDAWIAKLPGGTRGEWNYDVTLSLDTNQRLMQDAGFAPTKTEWVGEDHAVLVAHR